MLDPLSPDRDLPPTNLPGLSPASPLAGAQPGRALRRRTAASCMPRPTPPGPSFGAPAPRAGLGRALRRCMAAFCRLRPPRPPTPTRPSSVIWRYQRRCQADRPQRTTCSDLPGSSVSTSALVRRSMNGRSTWRAGAAASLKAGRRMRRSHDRRIPGVPVTGRRPLLQSVPVSKRGACAGAPAGCMTTGSVGRGPEPSRAQAATSALQQHVEHSSHAPPATGRQLAIPQCWAGRMHAKHRSTLQLVPKPVQGGARARRAQCAAGRAARGGPGAGAR
jgi:hypothetical protein